MAVFLYESKRKYMFLRTGYRIKSKDVMLFIAFLLVYLLGLGIRGMRTYSDDISILYNMDTETANYYTDFETPDKNMTTPNEIMTRVYGHNIDIRHSVKLLHEIGQSLSTEQRAYQAQNKYLVLQAMQAYTFIMANDHKIVKYCSKYYPVTTLKTKHDIIFKEKKNKAESVLKMAYGNIKKFNEVWSENPDVIKVFHEQIENDYQQAKSAAKQYGINNLTRQQFCEIVDRQAESIADADYKEFSAVVPNF